MLQFLTLLMVILTMPLFADSLLTDPMLQNPTPTSVNVVWFTEFPGIAHYVEYGEGLKQRAHCQTKQLSRMREDNTQSPGCHLRMVYRHEAVLTDLLPSKQTPYCAVSLKAENDPIKSSVYLCRPTPQPGTALKILLTSDHQVKPMVAANLQKVKEEFPDISAVFFAGDCVNYTDLASQWFDDPSGGGFFPCLQGKASRKIGSKTYSGGAILQSAPLFCALGNHEIMGRWTMARSLEEQFNDPYPKEIAEQAYKHLFPTLDDAVHRELWLKDHAFNTDSYEELFSLPTSPSGGKKYYATTFGDVRLVVLYATRIWRKPWPNLKGKYSENPEDLDHPLRWGYGDFIFESLEKGTPQYQWLESELQSAEFQAAKYKVVMLHNPLHSVGENCTPPFTPPIQQVDYDNKGKTTSIRYHYPKESDFLIRDVEPLLTKYGVQLVLNGHTHIWNRFQSPEGVHHLETSNVGNSYGAYIEEKRDLVPGHDAHNYIASGDPYGLSPIVPSLAPLFDAKGEPLPYISSNEITVFSILSTDTGTVDSYYFDTTKPDSHIVHFDSFHLSSEVKDEHQCLLELDSTQRR